MRTTHTLLRRKILLMLCTFAPAILWAQEQHPLVFDVENRGTDCQAVAGNLNTSTDKLPNPFEFTGGGIVSNGDDWSCRRNEIKADLETYEIGPKPDKPENITATYTGGTLTVRVTVGSNTLTLTSAVTMPSGTGPFPVIIGMNTPTGGLSSSVFSNCIQIPFKHDQVVNYNMNGSQSQTDPYYKIYPELWGKIGNYSAWSWGISRLIDGLELVKDQIKADLEHISVTGCSYAGKMALFGGALDERIALTLVQESGGGGINSWRLSQAFTTRTGTNVEKIDNTNYGWFKQSMKNLDPKKLPHDHHELIAMIAPRAVVIFGNPYQEWLGDESGYKTAMAALEVWKGMGIEDRFGFDFASGHNHCAASTSQTAAATAFVNKFLKEGTANTNIKSAPVNPAFNLDYATPIDWTTPTILAVPTNPNAPKISITAPASGSVIAIGSVLTITADVTDADNNVTNVAFTAGDTKIGDDATAPYSMTWTADASGDISLTATVTDADGNTAQSTVKVAVKAPQGPFGGTPHAIPGKIECEEFDTGGQDSAYFDDSPGSSVTPAITYRSGEDVDIEECSDTGDGYNLGWTTAGEWVEYTVTVAGTGTYDISIRVACNGAGRTVSLDMAGKPIATNIAIPNTADWQTWETVTVEDVQLNAGTQILRMTIGATDYVNLNYITFTPVSVETDLCPNDPNKTEPGECGCGTPEGRCAVAGLPLIKGWNLIGYPLAGTATLADALSSVWSNVEAIKDMEAFYISGNNPSLNSLTEVAWGKGYYIKVSAPCTLIWTE